MFGKHHSNETKNVMSNKRKGLINVFDLERKIKIQISKNVYELNRGRYVTFSSFEYRQWKTGLVLTTSMPGA